MKIHLTTFFDTEFKHTGLFKNKINNVLLYSQENFSMKYNPIYGFSNEEICSLIVKLMVNSTTDEYFLSVGYNVINSILLGLEVMELTKSKDVLQDFFYNEYKKMINDSKFELYENNIPYRTFITFSDLYRYSFNIKELRILYKEVENIDLNKVISSYEEKDILTKKRSEALFKLSEQISKNDDFFQKITSRLRAILTELVKYDEIFSAIKINPLLDGYIKSSYAQNLYHQKLNLDKNLSIFKKISEAMFTAKYENIFMSARKGPRDIVFFTNNQAIYPGYKL